MSQTVGPHRVVFYDVLQHEDNVCEGRPQRVRLQPTVTHDVKAAGSKAWSRRPWIGIGPQPEGECVVLCAFTYISGLHPSGFLFLWPMLMWYMTASDVSRFGYGSVPEMVEMVIIFFLWGCFIHT